MSTRRGGRRLSILLTVVYAVVGCATATLVFVLVRYSEGHAVTDAPRDWALITLAIYGVVYVASWAGFFSVRWVIRGFGAPD